MAQIKANIKSIAKQEKNRVRNNAMKTRVRKAIRFTREAALTQDKKVDEFLNNAKSLISVAVQKGIFHPNKGARKVSRLETFVIECKKNPKELKVEKKAVSKKEEVKVEVKKPAAKKEVKAKEVVKKESTKKTTTKSKATTKADK